MAKMIVFGGMNGYVPVKDNSHGGVDLGKAFNDDLVDTIGIEEYGWAQVKDEGWADSKTGEYWIEKSHLKAVVVPPTPEPEPTGDWVQYDQKWEGGKYFLKKV